MLIYKETSGINKEIPGIGLVHYCSGVVKDKLEIKQSIKI